MNQTYVPILPGSMISNSFWSKVDIKGPDECWKWIGAKDNRRWRYGRFYNGEKVVFAHRMSWELSNGEIPKFIDGRKAVIRHLCGNCLCVNPSHLAIGNCSDNANDRYKIGTYLEAWR